MAVLEGGGNGQRRFELAGPQTLTYDQITRVALRSFGRRRRLLHVPLPIVKAGLGAIGAVPRSNPFATWEEAELMEIPMTSQRGSGDAESLGVNPLRMSAVLAA